MTTPIETCTGVCTPVAVGPLSGIRCLHCNTPVEPDPRVAATAAAPSANTEATTAAVAARGARCDRCGHWTYSPATAPRPGQTPPVPLCRNCASRVVNADGEPMLIRLQGDRPVNARLLFPTPGTGAGTVAYGVNGIRRDPSADAMAATYGEGES